MEIIGLIPAGGKAERISPLPCSKEIYPIGFHSVGQGRRLRPKVVGQFLLDKMRKANIRKAYVVIREGKWDIPAYFRDGKLVDMHLAYLLMDLPFGVPYTIDQAYPYVDQAMVAFGFPDILFQPDDAFVRLIGRQGDSGADLLLGLLPASEPRAVDMVEVDPQGRVRTIQMKPSRTDLHYTWVIALWTPVFTDFIHAYVAGDAVGAGGYPQKPMERTMGDVIQSAIGSGLHVDSVAFPDGSCLDIGTPDNLVKAQCNHMF